jgi:hypothetical protein
MLPDYEFKFICLKMQDELENNKDFVCSLFEAFVLVLPIFPSSFWDRLMLVCFYVILYNVGGHERYYQMKKKYLDAPINNIYSKILKDEYDADVSSSEGSDVYANEVDANANEVGAGAGLGSGANASAGLGSGANANEVDANANEVDASANEVDASAGSSANEVGANASAGSSANEVGANASAGSSANEVDASAGLGSGANEVDSNSSRESIVGYVNVKGDDLN